MQTELHTQACPECGARDEETRLVGTDSKVTADLKGVYYCGLEDGSHEWQCMECGHNWLTVEGFVREPVAEEAAA